MTKPLLLIDVDGPLNPYAASTNTFNKFNRQHPDRRFKTHKILGFKVRLSRWHGEQLLALADTYELAWATTWEHNANEWIGPYIGLPKLPVIVFTGNEPDQPPAPGLFWKTAVVLDYCKGRPFVWLDDDFGKPDYDYVDEHHDAPARLHWVDPQTGITPDDFEALAKWAAEVAQ